MKLKTKADGKNGSTIKPIILAAAVLACSMSILYAMVVSKTTTIAISSVKPDAHPADTSKKTYKIDVSPNPVATGGTVTITVSKSCDDKSISVYVGTTAVSRKSTTGDWSGDYTAPDTGGEYTVTATDSCDDTFDRVTLTVVQLTGIKVSKDPHESGWHKTINVDGVDNYVALKSSDKDAVVTYEADIKPPTDSAKKYAHDKIVWGEPVTKSSGLTATVKANEELGPTPVTATLGDASKTMNNWIFWGKIKYNTTEKVNDSDKIRFNERKYNPHPLPDSEAEYAGSYHGPDANEVTYVCRNKLEIIGTLKPSGIGDILNADPNFPGLTFNLQLIERSRDWDVSPIITDQPITRKTRPDLAFIEGVNLQTQPIILDHIFATDIPGVNGVDKHDHSMAGYGAQAADFSDRIYITANTGNIPVSDEYYWHSFIKAHFSGNPVNAADFVTPTGFGPENPALPTHWGDPDKVWSK